MFESLSERLSDVFRKFGGRAGLDAASVDAALGEVRLALLDADVNLKVVRTFIENVREKCLGGDEEKRLTPAQQVVRVVHSELTALLGGEGGGLDLSGRPPHVLMLTGLQGSGKTTTAGKLAFYLRDLGHKPYFVPADVYRPAAIEQLASLASGLDMPCYPSTPFMNPVDIARDSIKAAQEAGCDVILLDTAGRLHIDETLMRELTAIKENIRPREILFVADAMTGQDAVGVAEAFDAALDISGVILTKMDGDARGGAAFSIRSVTGKNIKFVGIGEKISELEPFYPERVAGRILGMGDMLTLIEKAQASIEQEDAEELERKFRKAEFNFEDFRTQMRRMKKLGSVENLLKLVPGMGELRRRLGGIAAPDKEMNKLEAMINSMTKKERQRPGIINPSRKQRIAAGSGVTVADVNRLLKQFEQMRTMMQRMAGGGGKMPRGIPGLGGGLPRFPGANLPAGMDAQALGLMPNADMGAGFTQSTEEQQKLRKKRKEERQRKKKNRR
ncbi:MAG: signal recognition particle protein [Desulfovibrio sp.]|jgi:signal recognition particle subunit SRP54|nr:signal recognition particle protein [Desulfovibrio sp.]